jgi:hypothetical protein
MPPAARGFARHLAAALPLDSRISLITSLCFEHYPLYPRNPRFLFFLEHLNRFPRFVGWRLLVFQRAIQIHLGQEIVRIKFQETRK